MEPWRKEQVKMVETMNTHLETLKRTIDPLVRTCQIGVEGKEKKNGDSVAKMVYPHVFVDSKKKNFDADTHVQNMVFAVESLLGLVSQLKRIYIVRAPYREGAKDRGEIAAKLDKQSDRIFKTLKTISEEMNTGLKELEAEMLSSMWTKLPDDTQNLSEKNSK